MRRYFGRVPSLCKAAYALIRLVNAASPRTISIDKKKISPGTQGNALMKLKRNKIVLSLYPGSVLRSHKMNLIIVFSDGSGQPESIAPSLILIDSMDDIKETSTLLSPPSSNSLFTSRGE